MRKILLLCIALLGFASTASAASVATVDTPDEKYSVDNGISLDVVITVQDVIPSFGVVVDAPGLTADLGRANDKGFISFDLIMDTREHPRIRDNLVYSIHEKLKTLNLQQENPTIRSPVKI